MRIPPVVWIYANKGRFFRRALSQAGIERGFIHEEVVSGRTLYRVRIGPVTDVVQYDVLVEELANIGITDPYLITD